MNVSKAKNYTKALKNFLSSINSFAYENKYQHSKEMMFESMADWSLFYSINEIKLWYLEKVKSSKMIVEDIALKDLVSWNIDNETGNISHESKDFFHIHGLRIKSDNREVSDGWDQPILEQVGYDGGILGIIRKRFKGVPHYLCEAKEEPGNYNKVQISPTLQATFANINKSHGGRKPFFYEYFIDYDSSICNVLFDNWLSEDGGRLHLKRNRGILVEVDESVEIEMPSSRFIWLSLFQIKQLLDEDAWINPHVRGILSHA